MDADIEDRPIQSVVFHKDHYTTAQARAWLRELRLVSLGRADVGRRYWRYHMTPMDWRGKSYEVYDLPDEPGIQIIFEVDPRANEDIGGTMVNILNRLFGGAAGDRRD